MTEPPRPARPRGRGPLLISAASFSLGGAAVHLAVLPAQLQASRVYGGLFAVAGIAQVGLAVGLLVAPARERLLAAAAVSLALVAFWVLAHTVSLPGPDPWLPLDTVAGFADYLFLALEVLAAVLLVVAAARWPRDPLVRGRVAVVVASVQAVVDMFGAADLTDLGDSDSFTRAMAWLALGRSAGVRRSASPLSYLASGAAAGGRGVGGPSYLILHGTDDHSVHPRHSRELARRLAAAGSPVELVLVQGAQHGLNYPSQRPTPAQVTELVASFLTRSLASP